MLRQVLDHDVPLIHSKVNRFFKECKTFGTPTMEMIRLLSEFEANQRGYTFFPERVVDEQALYQQRRLANERKKSREAEKEIAAEKWARANLKPGMVIKLKGTRDRYGYRLVLSLGNHDIHCQQISGARSFDSENDIFTYGKLRLVKKPQTTNNCYSKVREYLNPETNKWEKVNVPVEDKQETV